MYKSEIKLFKSINKILMTKLVILGEEGEGGSSISFIEHLNSCKSSQIIQDCRPLTQVTEIISNTKPPVHLLQTST